ncbi:MULTISPECIES: alpha/beta hydrolase [unclassified Pseudonocardia]|uniref:alpha/beta hydrolase n=1 Tax=unclassified Pseudonocardia TaxID=2619320 RepID=UPI00192B272E|nr:alpha/beta hydrolase [Pseudonocardia sp. Ae707_Ps1]
MAGVGGSLPHGAEQSGSTGESDRWWETVVRVSDAMIDPELRRRGKVLRRVLKSSRSVDELGGSGPLPEVVSRWLRSRVPRGLTRDEEYVTRPDGSRLRLLIFRSATAGLATAEPGAPGLLWLHGGGYVSGAAEHETSAFSSMILGSGAVVVAPDYRLSTEAPFPAALDDCYSALLWLKDNAARLGVRSDQIAVGGGSAGGGLTAATTLVARDKAEVRVAFQMPIYPMIDDRDLTPTGQDNDAPVWDAVTNRSAWKLYLGELYGTADVPAYAAPSRATDYANLPPTMTYVGGVEAFRDETVRYVADLSEAGVPVEFREYPGAFHGFDVLVPKATVSRAATAFRNQWFGYAVRTFFAPQT